MEKRLEAFIIFIFLTIITFGLYAIFFWVSRQQETINLLSEINQEVKKNDNQRELEQVGMLKEKEVKEEKKKQEEEKKPKIVSAYEKYFKTGFWVALFGIIFIMIIMSFLGN